MNTKLEKKYAIVSITTQAIITENGELSYEQFAQELDKILQCPGCSAKLIDEVMCSDSPINLEITGTHPLIAQLQIASRNMALINLGDNPHENDHPTKTSKLQ